MDRFGLAALAGSGTLAAHEIGYLTDGTDSVSHAYFGVLGPVVVLAACVAAWVAAVNVLRNDPGRLPSLRSLASLQVIAFAALEIGERIAGDSLASLVSTPVVVGLLAQPVVAGVALALLRAGRRILAAFRTIPDRLPAVGLAERPAPLAVLVSNPLFTCLRLRGPPV